MENTNTTIKKEKQEKAVLVGIATNKQENLKLQEYLNELSFLAKTAGATPKAFFTQNLQKPNPKYYIGSGKIEEIYEYNKEHKIDVVIFDEELTPTQIRNLEKALQCKIMDRNGLILDIFAKRAQTAHARTQVELAQYEYLLPRLTGMWTHLQKQTGGIGTKGPGEREIETDRRIIRDKITRLKSKLKNIDKQKATQRSNRGNMVRVALIGYTNVGKSTIMNRLSKTDVFAENKLFATLDTTVRKVVVGNLPFLISDTVGFIRKLPHSLVESFKSTLDEVRESDLVVHVVDVSHPDFEEQIGVVNNTLAEIGAGDKPTIYVFNKVDAYKYVEKEETDLTPKNRENITLEEMKHSWMQKMNATTLFISAKNKTNFQEFRDILYKEVKRIHVQRYPYDHFLY
ncbi:MAG: GTPase HflX [Bacteroidales bacterium]|nr:GTPase HflX [Bacteroidales bacterium]MCF8333271.1 GTPase HflX [Bacteroidales bacterium]